MVFERTDGKAHVVERGDAIGLLLVTVPCSMFLTRCLSLARYTCVLCKKDRTLIFLVSVFQTMRIHI